MSRPTKELDAVALGFLQTCLEVGVGAAVAAWALSAMRLDLATTSERMRDLLVSREHIRLEMKHLRDTATALEPTENSTDRKLVDRTKDDQAQEIAAGLEVGSTEQQNHAPGGTP